MPLKDQKSDATRGGCAARDRQSIYMGMRQTNDKSDQTADYAPPDRHWIAPTKGESASILRRLHPQVPRLKPPLTELVDDTSCFWVQKVKDSIPYYD